MPASVADAIMSFQQHAVVWTGNSVTVTTRPLASPGCGEVILKLESIGLCSSDFHIWRGAKSGQAGVLGHEGAGVVLVVGPDTVGWNAGDYAIVNPLISCGSCDFCLSGRGHICQRREIIGYNGAGLLADVQIVPARSLMRPPPGLARHHGCLVEPLACVIHAQRRLTRVPDSLLILGCGPMGVMHAAYARHRGVRRVWIVDPRVDKLALAQAKKIPADEFIPLDRIRERVRELTDGRGAQAVVTANSVREGHELALEHTANGGELLAFASVLDHPGPIGSPGGLCDADAIHRREERRAVATHAGTITVVGAIGFDADSFAESAFLLAGPIDGGRFVTGRAALTDIPGLIANGWDDHLKISIHPHEYTH
jgi:L-iditol 2-dehydrogenase